MPTAKENDGLVEVTIRREETVSNGLENGYGFFKKGEKARVTREQAKSLRDADHAD